MEREGSWHSISRAALRPPVGLQVPGLIRLIVLVMLALAYLR
jgi:hypothetical protein